jgi:hypothetical protein
MARIHLNDPKATDNEKIIELLTQIKEELTQIRELKENEEEQETYTCDNCDEEQTGEPYKSVNKFTFCSDECFDNWESDTENN